MKKFFTIALIVGSAFAAVGCQEMCKSCKEEASIRKPDACNSCASAPADRAEDVHPLKEGDHAPSATLHRPDKQAVELSGYYAKKPTILIFYRGSWCPYCNKYLGQIAQTEPELIKLGYQILAISPDRPDAMHAMIDKNGYAYQLLSDSDMTLTKSFGLAFRVDESTIEKYHGYGIDLDKASGQSHHLLPVPAVYIVDTNGVIRFAQWNPDYKQRLDPKELIAAARRVVGP